MNMCLRFFTEELKLFKQSSIINYRALVCLYISLRSKLPDEILNKINTSPPFAIYKFLYHFTLDQKIVEKIDREYFKPYNDLEFILLDTVFHNLPETSKCNPSFLYLYFISMINSQNPFARTYEKTILSYVKKISNIPECIFQDTIEVASNFPSCSSFENFIRFYIKLLKVSIHQNSFKDRKL